MALVGRVIFLLPLALPRIFCCIRVASSCSLVESLDPSSYPVIRRDVCLRSREFSYQIIEDSEVEQCNRLLAMMDRVDVVIEEEDNGIRKLNDRMVESGWADAGAAVLCHGWWLGKRVVIAGAAIASAVVVIPPLFILSMLGLMLSFPFGVLIAGYACANKIIKTVLPVSPSKMENDDDLWLGTEESSETGMLNPIDKISREDEKWEKGENMARRSEGCGYMIVPREGEIEIKMLEFGSKSEIQKCVMESGFQEESIVAEQPAKTDKKEMEKDVKLRNDVAAEAEESRKKSRKITEEVGGEGTEPVVVVEKSVPAVSEGSAAPNKRSYAIVVMTPREEKMRENEPPNLSSEHSSIVELRGKVKANDKVENVQPKQGIIEEKEVGRQGEKGLSVVHVGVAKDERLLREHKSKIERSSSNAENAYISKAPTPKMVDAQNLEKVGSMERQGIAQPGAPAVAATVAGVIGDEGEGKEEKLWDQVLAMRTILGYKTKMHCSIGEELRALYLFTGVVPPVSLKDGVDLSKMTERLGFLKGIIGLK